MPTTEFQAYKAWIVLQPLTSNHIAVWDSVTKAGGRRELKAILTATSARQLAADLLRLADEVEE